MILVLFACRTATVVDACDADPAYCLPCTSDAACGYTGNACTETVYCAHEDAAVSVVMLGCDDALAYAWPDDDTCRCVAAQCAADE